MLSLVLRTLRTMPTPTDDIHMLINITDGDSINVLVDKFANSEHIRYDAAVMR